MGLEGRLTIGERADRCELIHDPNTPRPQQHTHGDDDRLKNYLRQNKLSANLLDDESDVIMLTGAKVRGA